ncbi:MAG: YjjG family noncanonical pyrimidine nucleotidase [Lachnospiraceae bacterium]
MKQYEVILMDVDGTLLDFNMAERMGIQEVMRAYGVKPTRELEEAYHQLNRKLWEAFERGDFPREHIMEVRFGQFFEKLGIQADGVEAEAVYRQQLNKSAVLIDGATECCSYLKDRYRMYVVTNGVSATQYKRLDDSGLSWFFQDIFVSEDAGSQKPQKEFFDYCFARIPRADPSKILIIGDSLTSDIMGGNAAGIDTCWFNPGKAVNDKGVEVTYEIRQLKELEGFL